MLQALLSRKLDRWLAKDAYAIEDLLTSVVLGSASYAPLHDALLPFLSAASDEAGRSLAGALADVVEVRLRFWPRWGALELPGEEVGEGDSDDLDEAVHVGASEPEVVVELVHNSGKRSVLLIEAKLHSGKSSHASGDSTVTDQLAKYWLQLRAKAKVIGATPLAVVYLTTASHAPLEALRASQKDLDTAGERAAPLFWLSWRRFVDVVNPQTSAPILHDVVKLLRERWNLVSVHVEPWPVPPELPENFTFRNRLAWPVPSTPVGGWTFETSSS